MNMKMPLRKETSKQWSRLLSRCSKLLSRCSRLHSTCNRLCKMLVLSRVLSRHHKRCKKVLLLLSRHPVRQTPMDSRVLNRAQSKVHNRVLHRMARACHSRHRLRRTTQSRVRQNVLRHVEILLKHKRLKTW